MGLKPRNWVVDNACSDRSNRLVVEMTPSWLALSPDSCAVFNAAMTVVLRPFSAITDSPAIWPLVRPTVSLVVRPPRVVVFRLLKAETTNPATIAEVRKPAASRAATSAPRKPRNWVVVADCKLNATRLVVDIAPNWAAVSAATCVVVSQLAAVVLSPLRVGAVKAATWVVVTADTVVVVRAARVPLSRPLSAVFDRLPTMVVVSRFSVFKAATSAARKPRNWVVVA